MSSIVFWCVCELSKTLGSLSADRWVCFSVLLIIWLEILWHWILRTVGLDWVLVLRWQPLQEFAPINIPWGLGFPGGTVAKTQHSYHGGSDSTPGWWTKTVWCNKKEGKKKKNKQENPKPNCHMKQTIKSKENKWTEQNKQKNKTKSNIKIKNKWIPWGFCYLCLCPHILLQPGDLPRPLGTSCPSS